MSPKHSETARMEMMAAIGRGRREEDARNRRLNFATSANRIHGFVSSPLTVAQLDPRQTEESKSGGHENKDSQCVHTHIDSHVTTEHPPQYTKTFANCAKHIAAQIKSNAKYTLLFAYIARKIARHILRVRQYMYELEYANNIYTIAHFFGGKGGN